MMKKIRLFNSVIAIILFSLCSCGNQTKQRDDGNNESTLPLFESVTVEFASYEELIADIDVDNKDDNFFIFNPTCLPEANRRYFKCGIKNISDTSHLVLNPYYPGIILETQDNDIVLYFYSKNDISSYEDITCSTVDEWYSKGPDFTNRNATMKIYNMTKSICDYYCILNGNSEIMLLVEYTTLKNVDMYNLLIMEQTELHSNK